MRHEARQVPSWLIFDVGQNMKKKIIYDKREFGHEVHEVEVELHDWNGHKSALKQFPPDNTVYAIICGSSIYFNDSFDEELYAKRVRDREWEREYEVRTGRKWDLGNAAKEAPGDKQEELMECTSREHALKILGLKACFTKAELGRAYKNAMKRNHPDRVADLDGDFRSMAERKAKLINMAREILEK
jgi:hypothetical protein